MLEPAAEAVRSLAKRDVALARELALRLLSLEHDPKPAGSRELAPSLTAGTAGERVWDPDPFVIVYLVSSKQRLVEIGSVEIR